MPNISWQQYRFIENSLKDFLDDQISSGSLTVFHEGENKDINVVIGYLEDTKIPNPNISVYQTTETSIRGFIGSNKRLDDYLVVIDIRALDDGMRGDLAVWVKDTINNGFPYYTYAPNPADPDNMLKTLAGNIELNFVTNFPVRLNNVEEYDKHRHNITISVDINGGGI